MSNPLANAETTKCGLCGNKTMFTITTRAHTLSNEIKAVKVSRCAKCDTVPCISCNSRTIRPRAPKCPQCETPMLPKGA